MTIRKDLFLEGITYYVHRYGCWMNDRDADAIAGILELHGAVAAESAEQADFVVFNTCSVSGIVEAKICNSLAHTSSESFLIVCGCFSQYAAKELAQRFPYINILMGAGNVDRLIDSIRMAIQSGETVIDETAPSITPDHLPAVRGSRITAYVSIMNGCFNRCSYCIVPYVRGPIVNRAANAIISEIQTLAQSGWREVTLVGHNVQQYSGEYRTNSLKQRRINFTDLLKLVADTGIERIRFLTSNPADLTIETLRLMADTESLCPSLHLPLQSGSDVILAAMHRRYTKKEYIDLVRSFYNLMPNGSLTTDVIIGFPGETEEDFNQTYELYQQLNFDGAYLFAYSLRPFTEAALLPDQVPGSLILQRFNQLQSLCDSQKKERAKRFKRTVQRVLITENNSLQVRGISENGWHVTLLHKNSPELGTICNVLISSVIDGVLYGYPIT